MKPDCRRSTKGRLRLSARRRKLTNLVAYNSARKCDLPCLTKDVLYNNSNNVRLRSNNEGETTSTTGLVLSYISDTSSECSSNVIDVPYIDTSSQEKDSSELLLLKNRRMASDNASSDSSEESDYQPPAAPREARTARKTTSRPASKTRRQAARNATKALRTTADNFIGDFNPETSVREKRKLSRKINPPSRRPAGALHDENGVHIVTGIDLCDCLQEDCVGCFFVECAKCGSNKCGTECRVHRKYLVEQIQYEGYDQIIKNPLMKH